MKLNAKKRQELRTSQFAVTGRRYPIPDEAHARLALAMVSKWGSSSEKAMVRAAVARKFPGITQGK